MKAGKTLVALATEIERRRKAKQDFVAPASKLGMAIDLAIVDGLRFLNRREIEKTQSGRSDEMTILTVKCVCCGHRFDVKASSEEPMCPRCYGPVTVVRATTEKKRTRRDAPDDDPTPSLLRRQAG